MNCVTTYRANVESIFCCGITSLFSNFSAKFRSQIQNLIERAGRIFWMQFLFSFQDIFEELVIKQGLKITKDIIHLLLKDGELMPSGKGYRVPNYSKTHPKHQTHLKTRKLELFDINS